MIRQVRRGRGADIIKVILGVSQDFVIGDVVKSYTTGAADLGVAATPILGVILSFCDANGKPLPAPTVAAGTASGNDVSTVTTDGTNSDGYYAMVDTSKESRFSAEVSGTIGTTSSSDEPGGWINVNSANTDYDELLETTFNRTAHSADGAMSNFYSWGVDPNDSTRLIVSIANSERDAQIDVTP